MKKENKYVFFFITHMYLVKTTSLYYLIELSTNYKVVLFVNEIYLQNIEVYNEIKKLKLFKIIHLKDVKPSFLKHHYYYKAFSSVLFKYKPVFVFLDNFVDTPTKYIIFLSKFIAPKASVIKYQNGLYEDVTNYYEFNFNKKINAYSKKFFLPKVIIKRIAIIIKNYRNFVNNIIMPSLTLFSLGNLSMVRNGFNNLLNFDYLLIYSAFDQLKIRNSHPEIKTIIIEHPLMTNRKYNYASQRQNTKTIVVLPSTIGLNGFDIDKDNIFFWHSILNLLAYTFNDYTVILKLHPRSKNSKDYSKIVEYIKNNITNIIILDPMTSAENLINDNFLIVGDVSTTLWYGTLLEKFVISIKIPNVPGNDLMKNYDGIVFVENLTQLNDVCLTFLNRDYDKEHLKSLIQYPSINKILNSLYDKSNF